MSPFIRTNVEKDQMSQEVELTCPTCQTFRKITVPAAIFAQKKFGTIKIQVPPGAVCREHQFIAFVDTKGIVRGYERIDLLMAMPGAAGVAHEATRLRAPSTSTRHMRQAPVGVAPFR